MKRPLIIHDRNKGERASAEAYEDTLAFQTSLLEAKVSDRGLDDVLVLVEHAPIYTVGRKQPHPSGDLDGVRAVEVGRGGKTTYHGPGQLVAYPIFDLEHHGRDVHQFLRNLEEVVILTLKELGIKARRRKDLTGVWVYAQYDWKKIASIGIGVRRWVSFHGLALNVTTDLRRFDAIDPCGLGTGVMTSLERVSEEKGINTPTMEVVKETLIDKFEFVFGFKRPTSKLLEKRKDRPSWLKVKAPGSPVFNDTYALVKELNLVTVCEEAHCPNIGECWSHKTATFMIMGELCTRRCSFCAVKDGALENLETLDPLEPLRVAKAVEKLGLRHVVVTSVNRDDLEDMGATHFNRTARALKHAIPDCKVEFLIPDMRGSKELLSMILEQGFVDVLNHNLETIPRLYKTVRPGAGFKRSLNILRWAKELQPGIRTKSGLMVGLGETKDEVLEVMDALREAHVDILTIGQYLQPTDKQLKVERFITPEEFQAYHDEGKARGFTHVESAPFVRSSYHAWKHTADAQDSSPEHSLVQLGSGAELA